ncbi:MAG: hypothetical protein HUU15_03170 [Candidatus Brocadiae bacterium]|nr:hypothetical protein [Candidatus Brocadiia bacterium]
MRPTLLTLALLLPALQAPAQELHRDRFASGVIRVEGKIQDCVLEDLDGDGRREMLLTHTVFGHDGAGTATRYVSVKRLDPGSLDGKPEQSWVVPAEATVLFFGNYTAAPGGEIGYLCPTGAFVWERNGGGYNLQPRRLFEDSTFFDIPQEDSLPLWYWPFDIDGNGLPDFLLPRHGAYTLSLQTEPGVYGRSYRLQMPAASRAEAGGAAWLRIVKALPRLELQDVNGDFRTDLCLIWHDRFDYYLQGAEATDAGSRATFPETPSGSIQLVFLRQRELRNQVATSITYLRDFNRGGGVDFLASFTRGELAKVDAIATDYYMYLGTGGKELAATTPNWRISLPGVSFNPQIQDLDGDGFDDLVVSSFETSMLSNAGKAVFQNIPVEYFVFLYNRATQTFSAEYDYRETVTVDIDRLGGGGGMPQLWFNGDWDGDGRKDILRLRSDGMLSAARGISVNTLLRKAPVDYEKTDLFRIGINDTDEKGEADPPAGVDIWEINGDGKADLVLRWSGRVRVLLTR